MKEQPIWTQDFLVISLCNFFIFIIHYSLIASLPMFVVRILSGSDDQVGLVMASFVVAAVLVRPFSGKWLDEVGRKRILLGGIILVMASTVLYFGIESFAALIALRFLHGLCFGTVTTATGTIAADVTPEQRKGEGMGYYGMFMNLAMIIGPFLSITIVIAYGFTPLFVILSTCSFLALLCGWVIRIPRSGVSPEKREKQPFHWQHFIEPKSVPSPWLLYL